MGWGTFPHEFLGIGEAFSTGRASFFVCFVYDFVPAGVVDLVEEFLWGGCLGATECAVEGRTDVSLVVTNGLDWGSEYTVSVNNTSIKHK